MKIIYLNSNYELMTSEKPVIKINGIEYYVLNESLIEAIGTQIEMSEIVPNCYRIVGNIDDDNVTIDDKELKTKVTFNINNFAKYYYEGAI